MTEETRPTGSVPPAGPTGSAGGAGPVGAAAAVDRCLRLACGAGSLRIAALQPAGGRRMAAPQFLNGYARLLAVPWGRPVPSVAEALVRPAES